MQKKFEKLNSSSLFGRYLLWISCVPADNVVLANEAMTSFQLFEGACVPPRHFRDQSSPRYPRKFLGFWALVVSQTITQKSKIISTQNTCSTGEFWFYLSFLFPEGVFLLKLESELHFQSFLVSFLFQKSEKYLEFSSQKWQKWAKTWHQNWNVHRCFPNASPHKSPYQRVAAVERLAPEERRPELCLPGSEIFGQISFHRVYFSADFGVLWCLLLRLWLWLWLLCNVK